MSERLERFVAESIERYVAGVFDPDVLVPTLVVCDERGIETLIFPNHERDVDVVMSKALTDLAVDADLWGYCALYRFRWPDPVEDGLLVWAGDRAAPSGLALFHPFERDARGALLGLRPPLFVKAPPTWFMSPPHSAR